MIRLTIEKTGYSVQIEGATPNEVIGQAELFSELPDVCPLCGSPLHFTHRKPRGFEYWGLGCTDGHETTFGEKKDGAELYYKGAASWADAPTRPRDTDHREAPPPPPARPRTRG